MANGSALLDPPADKQATANQLNADRNRDKMQRDLSGPRLNMPVSRPSAGGATRPNPSEMLQPSPEAFNNPPSPAQNAATLNAQRNLASGAQKQQAQATQKQQGEQPQEEEDESRLKLRHYIVLGVVLVLQDLMPLIGDLIAIGWLLGYITWTPVVALYLYFVWFLSPKRLRYKLLRGLFFGVAELIPVVGEFIPGWTALALYFYIMTSRDARTAPLRQAIDTKSGGAAGKAGAAVAGAAKGK